LFPHSSHGVFQMPTLTTDWLASTPKTWTDATVLRTAPPAALARADVFCWPPTIGRFGIRFRRDRHGVFGAGAYILQYFRGGKDHRVSLGKVGSLTFTDARAMAQAMIGDVARQL